MRLIINYAAVLMAFGVLLLISGCCCITLRDVNEFDILNAIHSHYYAEIDPGKCDPSFELCAEKRCPAEDRCQVKGAINGGAETYWVNREKCIGCGICVDTCPRAAIRLIRKKPQDVSLPPKNWAEWRKERLRQRGMDLSAYE